MGNWINVVLTAFGLSVVFFYAPAITVVAGLILAVYYHSQEIKNLAAGTIRFSQLLALGFCTALVAQVVLTLVFGASFHTMVKNGDLVAALTSGTALNTALTKELFALVIVYCLTYLTVTATTTPRWLFKAAMALSLLVMAFQCWDSSNKSHSFLRQELSAWTDARLAKLGGWLNRDTVFNEYSTRMPNVYFASSDAYLYGKDGEEMARGEAVALGSRWFHVVNGEAVTDKSGIVYLPVVSFNDEKKTGWLRVDRMSESEPLTPKVEALTPPLERPAEPKKIAAKPARVISRPVKSETVKPVVAKSEKIVSTVSSDKFLATTAGWTATPIIPDNGDVIRIGYFDDAESIDKIKLKVGAHVFEKMNRKWFGSQYFIDFRIVGDSMGYPLEVSIKHGDPIEVGVVKL